MAACTSVRISLPSSPCPWIACGSSCWPDKKSSWATWGSFYISINSIGAASAKEFNPAIHIRRLNVNWTCGQRFGELLEEAEFNLVATRSAARAVVKALKAGKTTVDLTGATGGGEDAGGGSNPGGGSDGDQGENPLG